MQAMEISRSALDVEWRRLEIIAENIANADVANRATEAPFHARHLVSGPKGDFASYLNPGKIADVAPSVDRLNGVAAYRVDSSVAAPRLVREPGSPYANADGYVSYPSIDHAEQMVLMVKTARAYEANIVAINTAREMYSKALELGRRA